MHEFVTAGLGIRLDYYKAVRILVRERGRITREKSVQRKTGGRMGGGAWNNQIN